MAAVATVSALAFNGMNVRCIAYSEPGRDPRAAHEALGPLRGTAFCAYLYLS